MQGRSKAEVHALARVRERGGSERRGGGTAVRGGGAWLAWLACLGELWVAFAG